MFPYCNFCLTKLQNNHLLTAAIDYDCVNYVDTIDEVHWEKVIILKDPNTIMNSKYVTGNYRERALNAKIFVEFFDTSVPMAFCYQVISSIEYFVFMQFFCLPSM